MSAQVCSSFQQHTWKKDVCANCLKPKKQHSVDATPQPAKRLSKITVTKEKEDEEMQNVETSGTETKQLPCQEIKKQSAIGSPKPVPLKAKPVVVSKLEKSRKPSGTGESGEKVSPAKKLQEELECRKNQNASSDDVISTVTAVDAGKVIHKQDEKVSVGDGQSEVCDGEMDREPVVTMLKSSKAKPRPQITPPQVPDASRISNSVKPSMLHNEEKTSGSHYYQVYDICAKGMSGKPEPVDISEQNGSGESGKRPADRMNACRMVDVNDDQQNNIAMPYTVVDVTVCQLNKDHLLSKGPPQLPLTPAPKRDSSIGLNNTLPSNRPRSTKDGNDLLRNASPNALRKSLMNDLSKSGLGDFNLDKQKSMLSSESHHKEAFDGRNGNQDVSKQQDFYEDVGCGSVDKDKHVSSTFEAKVTALAKLDISKALASASSASSSPILPRHDDARQDSENVTERHESPEISEIKSFDTSTIGRQEKGRKSSGKSFFQKFLKRGSKETEQLSNRSSCGTISIEPILNVPTIIQSPGESANKHVALGDNECVLVSVVSSKDKVPNLPSTNRQSSGNDVSEMSECSSSTVEMCEKLPELTIAAESEKCAEKLVTLSADKVDAAPNDSVKPVKPLPGKIPSTRPVCVNTIEEESAEGTLSAMAKEILAVTLDRQRSGLSSPRLHDEHSLLLDKIPYMDSQTDTTRSNALDASPTDSTDLDLNAARSRATKDTKPSKAPRKMMAPPPMAPPPPPPPLPPSASSKDLDSIRSSVSPKHSGNSATSYDLERAKRSISPSFQNTFTALGESNFISHNHFPLSATLPRKSSSLSSSSSASSSSTSSAVSSNFGDLKLRSSGGIVGVGLRQLDSAAKHARNKTVSEGVRFEKLLIAAAEEDGEKKLRDETASETLDWRASKFLNRALPAPPPAEHLPEQNNSLEDADDLYELVSQSEQSGDKNLDEEQLTYEDIDIYCKKNGSGSRGGANQTGVQKSASQKQAFSGSGVSPSSDLSGSNFNYYLEPVSDKEEGSRGRVPASKDSWRPCPAPRGSHAKALIGQELQNTMPYVNTRMINGQAPLNTSEGFEAMAGLIVNMLYHLTDRLYSSYITRFLKNRSDVMWTDFELLDFKPDIAQETVLYCQAKHLVLAPSGCVLRVTKGSSASDLSLEPMHANIISPLLCFNATATELETLNRKNGEEIPTTNGSSSVAVLLCTSVTTLNRHWELEHAKTAADTAAGGTQLEQSICHCLVEILNALLYLRESGCNVLRLSVDDVVMAQFSDNKWHPLMIPTTMTFNVCSDLDSAFLNDDVAQLLLHMLRIELSKGDRIESKVVPLTKYSRGFQRVLRMLHQKTWEGLEISRNLLEFLLWGPSEEEAKFVAMTVERDISFRVWLEVARCRMASELVLETDRRNLELANQAKFLCRVTEKSLLDVTKLLFE